MDTAPGPHLIDRFGADFRKVWLAGADCVLPFGVAVSGGPDSLALLLLCHAFKPGMVEAATVDHRLRPESGTEAEWVAAICARLGVAHRTIAVDVRAGNVQAEAREARYAALGAWAQERGLVALATAHHADDQAETLLMRLNRASGLRGLAGIRSTRSISSTGTLVFRPLLGWRKAELVSLVADAGLDAADDRSNRDPRFDRARIRSALADAPWVDAGAVAQSAAHLAQANEALEWAVGEEWARRVEESDAAIIYRPMGAPVAVRLRVIERAIGLCGGRDVRGGEIARLEERLKPGGKATLGGAIVEVAKGSWSFRSEPGRT